MKRLTVNWLLWTVVAMPLMLIALVINNAQSEENEAYCMECPGTVISTGCGGDEGYGCNVPVGCRLVLCSIDLGDRADAPDEFTGVLPPGKP
jgi:hypothetical protein